MGPNDTENPQLPFEDEEQATLPLGHVLERADDLADHEEIEEEIGL